MSLIRDLLRANANGLTESELLAAARAKQPWTAPRQVRGALEALGVIPREVGDTVTLRPSAVPAVDVAVGHL